MIFTSLPNNKKNKYCNNDKEKNTAPICYCRKKTLSSLSFSPFHAKQKISLSCTDTGLCQEAAVS